MESLDYLSRLLALPRVVVVIGLALGTHLIAITLRRVLLFVGELFVRRGAPKLRTMVFLISSTVVFTLYFLAFGAVLAEIGVPIMTYLATASVIGLAVGFGSQNIVQDVITGLTVILSDLLEINDMVEISGQTGIVKSIGMRFTVLQNSMGALVYIPNRTLTSMINYPRGYIRCIVDVELFADEETNRAIESIVEAMNASIVEQFPAIFRAPTEIEGRKTTTSDKTFLRIKFRMWPGRGSVIETTFRQDLLGRIKRVNSQYTDAMVSVNYEVDQAILPRGRR